MTLRTSLLPLAAAALLLGACGAPDEADESVAVEESMPTDLELSAKADGVNDWVLAPTLHAGEAQRATIAPASARRIYPFFVGAAAAKPVGVQLSATSANTGVQLAVFGPRAADGSWPATALSSAGYGASTKAPKLALTIKTPGLYRAVVSSYKRATAGSFEITSSCTAGCEGLDAVVSHKPGALVASRTVDVKVNALVGKASVEAWAIAQGTRTKVASQALENGAARLTLPSSLTDGDDLQLVVPGFDDGVLVRLWTPAAAGARLDRVQISDFGHVFGFSGAALYKDGAASFALTNETRHQRIGTATVKALLPGRAKQGLGAFDATVELPIMDANQQVAKAAQAKLPKSGDVLSVGALLSSTASSYSQRFGCFRYCGMSDESCVGGPVACP